jgi:Tol biopolymer transport system component
MFPPKLTCTLLAFALAAIGHVHIAEGQESQLPAGAFTVESVVTLDLGVAAVSAPKWSPDGQWIAFSLPKGEGIGIVRPDGSEQRKLTVEPGSGYGFAWSPDSSRIAYRASRREKSPRQYVFRVDELHLYSAGE